MASHEVASSICEAVGGGGGAAAVHRQAGAAAAVRGARPPAGRHTRTRFTST
jgi:hypothetical protein